MKKTVIILFLALFLSLSIASAKTVVIFDEAVAEEDSFEADGITYTVYEHDDYDAVRLSSSEYGSIIVQLGSTVLNDFYEYNLEAVEEVGPTVMFTIRIEMEEPELNLIRGLSEYNPLLGDIVTGTVEIENDEADTLIITFKENLPNEVTLLNPPDITKGTTTETQKSTIADIYWKGPLYSSEELLIEYEFTVDEYPSTGNVINFDDVEFLYEGDSGEVAGFVDPLSITLEKPLAMYFEMQNTEELLPGDEVEYHLVLENFVGEEITVDYMYVELPNVPLVDIDSEFVEEDGKYKWSGTIAKDESVSLPFTMKPTGGGTFELRADVAYSYAEFSELLAVATDSFGITVLPVIPTITLSSTTFDGGEEIGITYELENTDEEVSYSNENAKIESELFPTENYRIAIPKGLSFVVKTQSFIAPYTDQATTYDVKFSGGYAGERFEATETIIINEAVFTAPYAVVYTADDVTSDTTTLTMELVLLTEFADVPTKLSVAHSAPDFKKTISLSDAEIDAFFQTKSHTEQITIPTVTYTGDTDMTVQIKYSVGISEYIKTYTETIPVGPGSIVTPEPEVYIEEPVEEAPVEVPVEPVEEAEPQVVIKGEEEVHLQRILIFGGMIVGIAVIAGIVLFFIMRQKKQAQVEKGLEQMASTEEEKHQSLLQRAKEMVIHDVPKPEDGYQKLDSYIRHSVQQGNKPEHIKKILLKKGWLEEVVDSYIQRLQK